MPVQQNKIRITADDGVATLWLGGGAEFRLVDLHELAHRLDEVAQFPGVDLVVFRADSVPNTPSFWQAKPLLVQPDESAADRFARQGRALLERIRQFDLPTLGFLEGACSGLGLELALSCHERVGISGPKAYYGFGPTPTAWGGRQYAVELLGYRRAMQLVEGQLTARQAHQLGFLDRVCTQRRDKMDLQDWIDDRQQHAPRKKSEPWWKSRRFFAERQAFRKAALAGVFDPPSEQTAVLNPLQPLRNVALVGGHPHWPILAREWSLHGVTTQCVGFERPGYAEAIRTGRVTPLEATQAFARLADVPDAAELHPSDMVILDEKSVNMAMMLERDLPARVLLVLPELAAARLRDLAVRPQRILGWHWQTNQYAFSGEPPAMQQLSVWFCTLGVPHTIRVQESTGYKSIEVFQDEIDYDGIAIRGASSATSISLHSD